MIGSVSLVSNISEEVSLQRQLEQAQKQEVIATLAGGLAHNFNNLLMIIMGLTSLMLTKISPDHPAHTDLTDIERQVRAGREITKKLLSFRRASDFETQPLNLNNLVETTPTCSAGPGRIWLSRKNFPKNFLPWKWTPVRYSKSS